ncbi:hypothetical protein [Actinoplanes sp. NPDC026619]|uniref:hypothetical protein n=1 Tax=Actinoplanes sp. NPDC026619 TaxID=3155798 RepID=UPI0033FD4517
MELEAASARPRWDQRGVAALAVAYVVMQYLMTIGHHDEAYVGKTAIIYGVILATPTLTRRKDTFMVICGFLAVLVLIAGVLLIEAGYWVYLPAALPLLLAMIRIPERWTPFATPVILAATAALLVYFAFLVSIPALTW